MKWTYKTVVSEDTEDEFNNSVNYMLDCNSDLQLVKIEFEFREENNLFNKYTATLYFNER